MHSMPSQRVKTTGRYFAGSVDELQRRALGDVEVHVALQVDRAGEALAGRHDHASAARGLARRDRLGDGAVQSAPPAAAPKSTIGKSRSGNAGALMRARIASASANLRRNGGGLRLIGQQLLDLACQRG